MLSSNQTKGLAHSRQLFSACASSTPKLYTQVLGRHWETSPQPALPAGTGKGHCKVAQRVKPHRKEIPNTARTTSLRNCQATIQCKHQGNSRENSRLFQELRLSLLPSVHGPFSSHRSFFWVQLLAFYSHQSPEPHIPLCF